MLGPLEVRTDVDPGEIVEVAGARLRALAAAAALADRVLAACPQVRIMATSREPLNITGEALWTVGPLTCPARPFRRTA